MAHETKSLLPSCVIVAFVLTPMLERSINQTILLTNGDWSILWLRKSRIR